MITLTLSSCFVTDGLHSATFIITMQCNDFVHFTFSPVCWFVCWLCSIRDWSVKVILTICYSLKSVKSVFIVVVMCSVTDHWAKLYCTFSNCSLCDRLNLKKKNKSICALWLSVHRKSIVEQGFSHEFAFDNEALKTFVEFWICRKRLKFKRCRLWIWSSSHPYYYRHPWCVRRPFWQTSVTCVLWYLTVLFINCFFTIIFLRWTM